MRNNNRILLNLVILFSIVLFSEKSYSQITLITTGQSKDTSATGTALYSITSTNQITLLHDFRISDPTHPKEIVTDNSGLIYGISELGGKFNRGAIFSMDYQGTGFSIIHHISKEENITSNFCIGKDEKIYIFGGTKLYSMEIDGSLFQVSASIPLDNGYTDEITIDENGWLYGYFANVRDGERILFRMKTDGSDFKLLHNFGQLTDGDHLKINSVTGARVYGIYSISNGFLYSFKQDGTDFRIDYNFSYYTHGYSVSKGKKPVLVNGKLYFSSSHAILSYDTLSQQVQPLYFNSSVYFVNEPVFADSKFLSFSYNGLCSVDLSGNYTLVNSDNGSSLIYSSLYGGLYYLINGGKYNDAYVKFTFSNGSYFTSFHDFGNVPDGYQPRNIMKSVSGSIFGYTQYGGAFGSGVIYKLDKNGGNFRKIYDLNPTTGDNILGDLQMGSGNKLYGISSIRTTGYNRDYIIFSLDTTGSNYTILKYFDYSSYGSISAIKLVNGLIYGFGGGLPFRIFRMDTNGFGFTDLNVLNNSSQFGNSPYNIASYNGYLYGNTYGGGANGRGTFFRVKEDGTDFSTIHHIADTDGYEFLNGLAVASNNKIYTHSWMGGLNGGGTLISVDPNTLQFKVEYNFTNLGRGQTFPETPLLEASDQRLYCSRYGLLSTDLNGQSLLNLDYSSNGFSAGTSSSIIEVLNNNNFCDGSPAYFVSPISGSYYTYQWQIDTGNGFVDLGDNALYDGVYTPTLNIKTLSLGLNNYKYRCEINSGNEMIYSPIYFARIQNSWSGAVDNSWTNPSNWYCGKVPDANTNVYIPLGIINYPVITTPVVCKTLKVQKGASIIVASGGDLKIIN